MCMPLEAPYKAVRARCVGSFREQPGRNQQALAEALAEALAGQIRSGSGSMQSGFF